MKSLLFFLDTKEALIDISTKVYMEYVTNRLECVKRTSWGFIGS